MTVLPYVLATLIGLGLLGWAAMALDAARLAAGIRIAGPVAIGVAGVAMLFLGRAGIGGMLISLALGWYLSGRGKRGVRKAPGRHSTVRTAALEMDLDHDSGALEGLVLAGTFESRRLGELDLEELLKLGRELASDGETMQLLEAYLDSRFPVWREHAYADVGGGQGGAPASGSMTQEEAYQVLGLEAGASAAEIRKAHRRLMQRLHPDLGGTSFLASRINEAKDVLLSGHK